MFEPSYDGCACSTDELLAMTFVRSSSCGQPNSLFASCTLRIIRTNNKEMNFLFTKPKYFQQFIEIWYLWILLWRECVFVASS